MILLGLIGEVEVAWDDWEVFDLGDDGREEFFG